MRKKYKTLMAVTAVLLLIGLGWRTITARAEQPIELKSALAFSGSSLFSTGRLDALLAPVNLTNANCIMCHQYEQFDGITGDSLLVSLTIHEDRYNQSVHGEAGILCVSCHTTFTTYPHYETEQVTCEQCHEQRIAVKAPLPHADRRDMKLKFNETCRNCHSTQYSSKSIHDEVAQRGEVEPPLCADCHGSHEVQRPSDPPSRVAVTCGNCHPSISTDFLDGAHYAANPANQTCVSCHIAHEAKAGEVESEPTPPPTTDTAGAHTSYLDQWNGTCTMCHAYTNLIGKAQDSSTVSLTVTEDEVFNSVHGKAGLGCAACHKSITGYPHADEVQVPCSACHGSADPDREIIADLPHASARDLSIEMNAACRSCHEEEYNATADSMHTKSMLDGNLQAPLCADCHGSHAIQSPSALRANISESCAECHASVYTSYQYSVHAAAIDKDGSPDAPTCADCHGVHNVTGPRQVNFRSESVGICIRCHQDEERMSKYDLDAALFSENVDSYHGVALSLFSHPGSTPTGSEPVSQTAVCYDCHGPHTIRSADDPLSSIHPDNLLNACKKCHPDATDSLVSAGVGHSIEDQPTLLLISSIDRIYSTFSYAAITFIILYLLLDWRRKSISKKQLLQPALMEE